MAIVHFVKSKRTQTVGGLNAVINYCCKDAKGDSWKLNLEINIDECMTLARDREHLIRLMEYSGYEVKWTADRKNITYTTRTVTSAGTVN